MIPLFETLFAQRLAWTLVHFLWQGALLGVAAWTAFALTRRRRPQVRYLLGCTFLLACLGSTTATFLLLKPRPLPPLQITTPAPAAPLVPLSPDSAAIVLPAMPAEPSLPWQIRIQPYLPWVAAAWALGVLFLSLRAAGGWLWLRGLKASATLITEPAWLQDLVRRSGLRRAVRFLESARVGTPMCLGLIRPVVLLPLGFFANLDPLAAEAVLAHELAHLRRLDGLVNGLQCVIEILLFFHPAVWWISRRIRTEREHCCDDAAVLACGDAVLYAETLCRLDELRDRPPALALQARGGNLMERLRRLLASDPPRLRVTTPALTVATLLVLLTALPAQAAKSEPARLIQVALPSPVVQPAQAEPIPGPAITVAPRFGPSIVGESAPLPIRPDAVPESAPQLPPGAAAHGFRPPSVPEATPSPAPAPPEPSVIVLKASDLEIVPGFAIRTVKVPQCPVIIEDQLLTWPNKGYAVEVPAHALVSFRVKCETGEAYFWAGVTDKWGKALPGMKRSEGVPWASYANTSDRPVRVLFVVLTRPGYPGDGKIQVHFSQQAIPGNPRLGGQSTETPTGQPGTSASTPRQDSSAAVLPVAGAVPTEEEARRILQAYADQQAPRNGPPSRVLDVTIGQKQRWNGAYLGRWPEPSGKPPLFQAIQPVDGWLVNFQLRTMQGTREPMTVLLDRGGVIHWRKAWPALPYGVGLMDTTKH